MRDFLPWIALCQNKLRPRWFAVCRTSSADDVPEGQIPFFDVSKKLVHDDVALIHSPVTPVFATMRLSVFGLRPRRPGDGLPYFPLLAAAPLLAVTVTTLPVCFDSVTSVSTWTFMRRESAVLSSSDTSGSSSGASRLLRWTIVTFVPIASKKWANSAAMYPRR